jgi:Uncharacterized protein conserved in bacteria
MNMVVLLLLYPIVLLFGTFVVNPYFLGWAKLPFPVALFLSNVASIVLLNYLVPWISKRFSWWLNPTATGLGRINLGGLGAALVSVHLDGVCLHLAFLILLWLLS